MITIIMKQPNTYSFEFKATNFAEGLIEAKAKYEKLGLIGRCYVIGSEGSHFII